ncbi:unnamed protein product [Fraxinus pennsylvanica]|uniref:Uncharacterized protein n=1 Tax=Fraxinus pennsylvanica TaxID=56036 RepID=A0AAD2DP77_9LAMI|nr:unnamed protein product [Fraxinus pennsylvanica]
MFHSIKSLEDFLKIPAISGESLKSFIFSTTRFMAKSRLVSHTCLILTGSLPSGFGNLSALQQLDLDRNSLTATMGNGLPNIESVYFGGNQFSGLIPSSIAKAWKLTLLYLFNNMFSGYVLLDLGNLQHLDSLRLAKNQLKNDPFFLELEFLVPLRNFSSGIKGTIPREVGNLGNLWLLSIGGNDLTGSLPQALKDSRKMQALNLHCCKFQGSIPKNFCNFTKLYHLDLGENRLFGEVPGCLGDITALREIHLAFNGFNSTITSALWSNKDIEILKTCLTIIPVVFLAQEIGRLKSMRELYLSGNRLSGDIPSTIGQLQSLIDLTLSDNKLHGSIPKSFVNLLDLEY